MKKMVVLWLYTEGVSDFGFCISDFGFRKSNDIALNLYLSFIVHHCPRNYNALS